MSSNGSPEPVICGKCGRPSAAGTVSCGGCGEDLSESHGPRDTIPYNSNSLPPAATSSVDAGPVVLTTAASGETLFRLRALLDELSSRGFRRFPGELLWPDEGGGELLQAV